MKCRTKPGEKPPSARKSRSVWSSVGASPSAAARTARARRWKRGISSSIRQCSRERSEDRWAKRPRGPSAPAYSTPVPASLTESDISEGWVAMPSSAKSRSSVG